MPTTTFRTTEFSFFHVALIEDTPATGDQEKGTLIDLLTWRQMITMALTRDHGLFGSSIHVDILHQFTPGISEPPLRITKTLNNEPNVPPGVQSIIFRVPRVNKRVVWEAISGWVDLEHGRAFRIVGVSDHLTALL